MTQGATALPRPAPVEAVIAVVGGGISGLALGHYLGNAGVDWVLLEARDDVGGILRTVEVDGHPLDVGAQRTRMTAHVRELVDSAGLADELIVASPELPLHVYRDGRLRRVPFSLAGAVSTDLISLPGKLRILLEPLTAGLRPDETAERFLVRKFGREAYENFLGPLYGGLYASDPARMPARHALAGALRTFGVTGRSLLLALLGRRGGDPPPTITFREGMQALPRGLARLHGERVRTGVSVTSVEPATGDRWVLITNDGPVEADLVVLTTPADISAGLLEVVAPEAAARLRTLRYNHLAVVHLRSEVELESFGYQVAFGETLKTRGVTFNSAAFGRDGVVTVYMGGMKDPDLPDWPDDRIAEAARTELGLVTGADADVLHVARTRIPAWDDTWDALEGMSLPEGIHLCANYTGRPGVPGRAVQAKRLAVELTAG